MKGTLSKSSLLLLFFCLVLFGHVFHKMETAVVDRGLRMDVKGSQVANRICNNKVCSFGLRSALCYMEGRTERERERESRQGSSALHNPKKRELLDKRYLSYNLIKLTESRFNGLLLYRSLHCRSISIIASEHGHVHHLVRLCWDT